MIVKRDNVEDQLSKNLDLVIWGPTYATGVMYIDKQHKELVNLTNQLFQACLECGNETVCIIFKEAMSRMVEYVRFHFNAESELLERINYPDYKEHKKLHEKLVKTILDAAKDYNEGKKYVPNNFARTLKEWVFGHIAVADKIWAAFIQEQRKKGLLSDRQLEIN